MQCDCVLTSLRIVENKVCCSACRIGHSIPIPGKALAGNNCCISMYAIVDRQMQGDCVLTSLRIVENKVCCLVCSVGHSIPIPGEALAGYNRCIAVHSTIDRQMQGDCVLTSLRIIKNKVCCRAC